MKGKAWAVPCKAMGMGLPEALGLQPPPQCIQEVGHGLKEDSSSALKLDIAFTVGFKTYLGLAILLFFPMSPCWNGKIYPMPHLPVCLGSQ